MDQSKLMKHTLSVIIPVLNEEKTLGEILKQVSSRKEVAEIIVVNDGSIDNSVKIIKQFPSPKVKLVSHKVNKGKGAAIQTGLKKTTGEYVIIQDADLEYYPSDYPILLKPLLEKKADFVVGNRWQNRRKGYLLAQMGNWYLTNLTNLLFKSSLKDTYNCYKIGPKVIWEKLSLSSVGFEIEAEIVSKLVNLNLKIGEVPTRYNPRTFKEGKKINILDVFKGTAKLFQLFKQTRQKQS